ncbi:MAG: YggT family protein [Alphaproteobacteria bacterium]
MRTLFMLIDQVLGWYQFLVILAVASTWLIQFNIINPRQQLVAVILNFLERITDPVFRFIRRFVPLIGGIDISPIILILAVTLLRGWLREYGPLGFSPL